MNKVSSRLAPIAIASPTSGSKSIANLLDELVKADFSDGPDTTSADILMKLKGVASRDVRNWLEDPGANALEKRAKRLSNALEKTRCTEQNLWLALVESSAPDDGERKVNEDVITRTCLALARSQSQDLVVCDKLFGMVEDVGDEKAKKGLLTSMACQLIGDTKSPWLSSAVKDRMTTSVSKLPGPAREKLVRKLANTADLCGVKNPSNWQFITLLAGPSGPKDEFKISGDTFEIMINALDENGVLDAQTWRQVLECAPSAVLEENMPVVLDVLQRHGCADSETWTAALIRVPPQSRAEECLNLMAHYDDMPSAVVDAVFRCMVGLEPMDVGKLLVGLVTKDPSDDTVGKALCQLHRLLDSADITGQADGPCVMILKMCVEGGLSWDDLIALLPPPSDPGSVAAVCAMLLALGSVSELTQQRRTLLLNDPGIAADKSVTTALAYVLSTRSLCVKWSQVAETDSLSPRDEPGATLVREFSAYMATRFEKAGATTNDKRLEVASWVKEEIEQSRGVSSLIIRRLRSFADLEVERYKFAVAARGSSNPYLHKMRCPEEDGWRLLMDAKYSEHGMYHFDNECGYMAGMQRGLNWVLHKLDVPLTPDLYRELHDTAIDGVFDLGGHFVVTRAGEGSRHLWNWEFAKGYRSGRVRFGLNFEKGGNATEAGFAEYRADRSKSQPNGNVDGSKWIECIENNEYSPSVPHLSDRYILTMPPVQDTADIKTKVEEIIQTYYSELSAARSLQDPHHREQAVLTCIVKCCQDLDQYHAFSDGNIRTVMLLMNKFLLENGYSPTILNDPNVIDMHSLRELVDLIGQGQRVFASLLLSET